MSEQEVKKEIPRDMQVPPPADYPSPPEAPKVEAPVEAPKRADEMKTAAAEKLAGTAPNERAAVKAAAVAVKASEDAKIAEAIGVQNVVEIIQFGAAVAKAIKEAKADGKIDLKDVGLLFPVAPLVVPMIDGIGQVPKELGDLDDSELAVLLAEVGKALGAESNAKLALQIKAGLKFAHAGYEFYRTF